MSLAIRPATVLDEEAAVALWLACGLVIPANDPAADFRFALGRPGSDVLVGCDAGGAVRATAMVGHDGHRGWLWYVATDPECRGMGHGGAMVAAAEDWLRERGVPKLHLLVRDTNTAVVGFYERLGFAVAPRVLLAKRLDESPSEGPARHPPSP